MRYNLPERAAALAHVAAFLGEDMSRLDQAAGAERAIAVVERLRADIGIPTKLRDIGVLEEQLLPFAEKAFSIKRLMRVNPRHPSSAEEIEAVYRAAW
jgi:alcohol dehydrogenase class IV